MDVNTLSGDVLSAAMKVHSKLGPGLLESVYETCLAHELRQRDHQVATQVAVPVRYDGLCLEAGYRIDMLVDDAVVELKAVESLERIHEVQLLTYLKMSDKTVGLLINFNVVHLRDGIKRVSNHAPNLTRTEPDSSSATPLRPPRPPR